jgi:hypothetical protein
MRRFLGTLHLAALLCVVGCHLPFINRVEDDRGGLVGLKTEPKVVDLVAYLNDNAHKVQAVQCTKVYIDAKQGNKVIGMDAYLACEKPRNFRMKAKVAGNYVADFGSNSDEFWYWISQADPPYVYHCTYDEMKTGRVGLPFPFQPDMVIAALGIGEYDPNAKYELRTNKDTVELIEPTQSVQGKPVFKVTVFQRGSVSTTRPQVLAYRLVDDKGKDIAVARINEVQVNKESGAVLPRRVQLVWVPDKADDKIEMKMTFENMQPASFERDAKGRLFDRQDAVAGRQGFDLARWAVDPTPGGMGTSMSIQRTNGTTTVPSPR